MIWKHSRPIVSKEISYIHIYKKGIEIKQRSVMQYHIYIYIKLDLKSNRGIIEEVHIHISWRKPSLMIIHIPTGIGIKQDLVVAHIYI